MKGSVSGYARRRVRPGVASIPEAPAVRSGVTLELELEVGRAGGVLQRGFVVDRPLLEKLIQAGVEVHHALSQRAFLDEIAKLLDLERIEDVFAHQLRAGHDLA